MTREQLLALIAYAVATVLEVDAAQVSAGTHFVADLRADSLALVEIVEIVETEVVRSRPGFHIDDEDIEDLLTVGDAVEYALARV